QRFTVFALFFDGEGEGTMELVCTRLENEQDVWNYHRWYTFPGRGLPAYLEVKATKCVFPAPGRYRLKLRFDSQDLTDRYFDVARPRGRSWPSRPTRRPRFWKTTKAAPG